MEHPLNRVTKAFVSLGLALGISGAASAAMYVPPAAPPCTPANVTVPCESSAWDLGVEAFYARLVSETNYYWAFKDTALNATTGHREWRDQDPHGWGFRIEASYHWGTGSDLVVNWTHIEDKVDDVFSDYSSPYLFAGIGPARFANLVEWHTIADWKDVDLDIVNLEFGQHVDYGEYVDVRFHSGVSYARLDHDIEIAGKITNAAAIPANFFLNDARSVKVESTFHGVGPRFGTDSSYNFGNGFGLVGKVAVSLLAGTIKSKTTAVTVDAAVPAALVTYTFTDHCSTQALVASLETRLGVKYTHAMAAGDLTFEGGYQANLYQHILQTPSATSAPSAVNHNYGYYGPYIGLKWVGNA